jgi:hypothetical protein
MMEALGTSETSVFTKATQRKNQEDDILHSNRRENFKPYIMYSCLVKILIIINYIMTVGLGIATGLVLKSVFWDIMPGI